MYINEESIIRFIGNQVIQKHEAKCLWKNFLLV